MSDTQAGNALIAEFMGIKWASIQDTDGSYHVVDQEKSRIENEWVPVEYHTSWDWLIPVVEKIIIKRVVESYSFRFGEFKIWTETGDVIKSPCSPHNNSITECWIAVVEFITWHNLQNKTNTHVKE